LTGSLPLDRTCRFRIRERSTGAAMERPAKPAARRGLRSSRRLGDRESRITPVRLHRITPVRFHHSCQAPESLRNGPDHPLLELLDRRLPREVDGRGSPTAGASFLCARHMAARAQRKGGARPIMGCEPAIVGASLSEESAVDQESVTRNVCRSRSATAWHSGRDELLVGTVAQDR